MSIFRIPKNLFPLCILVSGSAVPASAYADVANKQPGVYKEVTVSSFTDCNALCKADSPKCRATEAVQPDTNYDVMQCKLFEGLSANSPYFIAPPKPLNLNIALADLNSYRASKGLSPVILNEKLNRASEVHAADLAKHGIISHTGTDGSGHAERATRQGYRFRMVAENVATGQDSWEEAFKAWQDSPGHDKNLLQKNATEFGIAIVFDRTTKYHTYWAMLVGTPAQ